MHTDAQPDKQAPVAPGAGHLCADAHIRYAKRQQLHNGMSTMGAVVVFNLTQAVPCQQHHAEHNTAHIVSRHVSLQVRVGLPAVLAARLAPRPAVQAYRTAVHQCGYVAYVQ